MGSVRDAKLGFLMGQWRDFKKFVNNLKLKENCMPWLFSEERVPHHFP
jgi:hypothetical protein